MADVSTHSTLPTSLTSYWELEEASGTRVDSAGSNDLTDVNTVTSTTGKQGTAASFDKSNTEYLTRSNQIIGTGNFSVAGWFKTVDRTVGQMIFGQGLIGSGTSIISVYIESSNINFRLRNSSGGNIKSVAVSIPSDDVFYFVAATFTESSGRMAISIDGGTETTDTFAGGTITDGNRHRIGADAFNATQLLDGAVDELGVWAKLLSASEISDLYASGDGLPYLESAVTFTPKVMMF